MTTTEQLWKKIMNATSENVKTLFSEYCDSVIAEKEQEGLVVEAAAYKICGLVQKDFPKDIEAIINHACELEIPREMSKGAGINIGDKWDADAAHAYKEQGWQELVRKIKELQ